jgi:hypothetical protein
MLLENLPKVLEWLRSPRRPLGAQACVFCNARVSRRSELVVLFSKMVLH